MIDWNQRLHMEIFNVAEQSHSRYVRGILSVKELAERIAKELETLRVNIEYPSRAMLTRIAQRICSRELYAAWRSSNEYLCNCAFTNLRNYLEFSLLHSGYASALLFYENGAEDVLHQTLEELYRLHLKSFGLDDPTSFLKWTQTILLRYAYAYLQKCRQNQSISLDVQLEVDEDQFASADESDPYTYVEDRELHQILKDAILSLRNRRYQQVLLHTYLDGMDEATLAARLQVQVQDVYMWRHRALKQLRSNTELMERLRSLRR